MKEMVLLFSIAGLFCAEVSGTNRTLDEDGGADYTSLDAALSDISNGNFNADTLLFTGSDIDTYTWSQYVNQTTTVSFVGQSANPDNFPVINHTAQDGYQFFGQSNIYFARLVLTGSAQFKSSNASGKVHSFKKCVFRDFTGTNGVFLQVEQGVASVIEFENCLFENNQSIFQLNVWGGSPTFNIINCTFDNNTRIFDINQSNSDANFNFINNIYSGSPVDPLPTSALEARASYTLTSEACDNYGTGCISSADPGYGQQTRENPSDWQISAGSAARGIGTSSGSPADDIAGSSRGLPPSAGAWIIFDGEKLPLLALPSDDSYDNSSLDIDFTLPVAADAGSVNLIFERTSGSADGSSPHEITLVPALEGAGQQTAVLDGNDLSASSSAASVSSDPADALVSGAVYRVSLQYNSNAVTYTDSNSNFTYDAMAPVVSSLSPADERDGFEVDGNLAITFNEAVYAGTGAVAIRRTSNDNLVETIDVISGQVTGAGTAVITINPDGNLTGGTEYYIQIDADAFEDVAGNDYAGISTATDWNFTTIDSAPPVIAVNPLITSLSSPEITGTISDLTALVNVTIGQETFTAGISQDGSWSVAQGTFTPLGEGTYDIQVTATNTAGFATDNTTDELVIITAVPEVTVNDLVTNTVSPALAGTVNDPNAAVAVSIGIQSVQAVNNGDGSWALPAGSLAPLAEDSLSVLVSATNQVSLTGYDTGTVIVDITAPQAVVLSPGTSSKINFNPVLSITFSEAVFPGFGNLMLYQAGGSGVLETIAVETSTQVSGWGTTRIQMALLTTLEASTTYYMNVGGGCFSDLAGNFYSGITDSTTWTFTTLTPGDPVIESISILSPAVLYKMDDTVRFAIHFSDSVTLTGGDLVLTLETGLTDRTVRIVQFGAYTDSASASYVVQYGDSAESLQVVSLTLTPGAVMRNAGGRDLVLDAGPDNNLPPGVRIDGVVPLIDGVLPASNAVVQVPLVSYVLSETMLSGSVSWEDGYLNGAPLGPLAREDSILSTADLAVGSHEIMLPYDNLLPGAIYTLIVSVRDSAGNEKAIIHTVKLSTLLNMVRIIPGDTNVALGASVQFRAVGRSSADAEASEVPLDSGLTWSAQGPGVINDQGAFVVSGLGECLVTVTYGTASDTAGVTVDSGAISVPAGGDTSIWIGTDVELVFPSLPGLTSSTVNVEFVEAASRPADLTLSGPALGFEELIEGVPWTIAGGSMVSLRLKIDSSLATGADKNKVQVYQPGLNGGPWIRIPSSRQGDWLVITTDTLGTYLAALDNQAPSLSWVSPMVLEAEAGQALNIHYQADDNIANPEVKLIVHVGGDAGNALEQVLTYQKASSSNAVIPGTLVTDRGLWYTVEISDGPNTVSLDRVDISVRLTDSLSMPDLITQGAYRLFSIPSDPGDKSVEALFSDDWGGQDPEVWRLYGYESEFIEMGSQDEALPGRAYWLRTRGFDAAVTLDPGSAYTLPVSRDFVMPLRPGWNCISNPFLFNVRRENITLDNNGEVQNIYGYENGEWINGAFIANIEPWKGYILWNGQPGSQLSDSLRIPALEFVPTLGKRGSADGQGVWIGLRAISGSSRDGLAVMGFDYPGSQDGRDTRDLPKPDLFSGALNLGLEVAWDEHQAYLTDYRGELGDGKSWRFTVSNGSQDRARLEFMSLDKLPNGINAVLLDEARGKEWAISAEETNVEYLRKSASEEKFTLLIGTPGYLEKETAVFKDRTRVFSLEQNFPNPFQGATTIRYSVPRGPDGLMPVRLDIYDLQGRLVKEVVNSNQISGMYTSIWNGLDNRGKKVPAGTYIYRLKAGDRQVFRRKMLFIR
ncbi:Ig-like domain-containing protein [Fibrobacterota bacterium]